MKSTKGKLPDMTQEHIYLIAYIFFGVETVLCLNRAFNKSPRLLAKAFWIALGFVGVAGLTATYAMSR